MDHNPFQALSQRARRDARRNAKKDDIGLDEETLLAPFQAFKMDNIGLDKETLKLATLLEREAHEPRAPLTSSPGSEDAPADILQNQAASQDDARLNRNTMRPFFSNSQGALEGQGWPKLPVRAGPIPGQTANGDKAVGMLDHEQLTDDDQILVAAPDEVKITVAADSGAVENVIDGDDLPGSVRITPNTTGWRWSSWRLRL